MTSTPQGIEAKVRAMAQEVALRSGYDLIDVEYRREPSGWTLRLFIDKPGGVNLEDCQRLSQELTALLDVEDPIPHKYNLEVSSPGLDRPLRRGRDFEAARGKRIKAVTREPIEGRRNFTGRLRDIRTAADPDGAGVLVLDDEGSGAQQSIPIDTLVRARLVYEWPTAGHQRKTGRKR